jgi:hypothetical protein
MPTIPGVNVLVEQFGVTVVSENPTFQALGSGIYWMVTVNAVVWMVAPLVAVTVRG